MLNCYVLKVLFCSLINCCEKFQTIVTYLHIFIFGKHQIFLIFLSLSLLTYVSNFYKITICWAKIISSFCFIKLSCIFFCEKTTKGSKWIFFQSVYHFLFHSAQLVEFGGIWIFWLQTPNIYSFMCLI
jgi:hypothetical protein